MLSFSLLLSPFEYPWQSYLEKILTANELAVDTTLIKIHSLVTAGYIHNSILA